MDKVLRDKLDEAYLTLDSAIKRFEELVQEQPTEIALEKEKRRKFKWLLKSAQGSVRHVKLGLQHRDKL